MIEDEEDVDICWWVKNPAQHPNTKIGVPEFEGDDPCGWILKVEKYFCYYQTLDDLKIDVAAMYLESDVLIFSH